MKFILFIFVSLSTCPTFLFASAGSFIMRETLFLTGTIANQNVSMVLHIQDGSVSGTYVYDKYESPISLSGQKNNEEFSLGENEARLELNISGRTAIGTWSGKNGRFFDIFLELSTVPRRDILKSISGSPKEILIELANGDWQRFSIEALEESVMVDLEDFNFDGYQDIRVLTLGGIPNSSHMYFSYNPKKGKYEASGYPINEISNPKIIHSKKIVVGLSRSTCCSYTVKKIVEGNLYRAEFDYESGNGVEMAANSGRGKAISKGEFERNYMSITESGLP